MSDHIGFIYFWLFMLTWIALARGSGITPQQQSWLRDQMEKEGRERYE